MRQRFGIRGATRRLAVRRRSSFVASELLGKRPEVSVVKPSYERCSKNFRLATCNMNDVAA